MAKNEEPSKIFTMRQTEGGKRLFTGIIEELGTIRKIGGGSLTIAARTVLTDARIGDSIAVNGVCLTITRFDAGSFTADVMPETVRRTSFDGLHPGAVVNLERAVAVGTRLGGHIVSGHIDGTGDVTAIEREGNAVLITVAAAPNLLRGIVEKGSVALEGISLTVAAVDDQTFTVSLIPHTLEVTNLHTKKKGSRVNIETDVIGKYVERLLRMPGSSEQVEPQTETGLTEAFLRNCGF